MKENDKLINVIIDIGIAVKELCGEVKELRGEVKELGHEIKGLQKHQQRTNVELSEMRLTFI